MPLRGLRLCILPERGRAQRKPAPHHYKSNTQLLTSHERFIPDFSAPYDALTYRFRPATEHVSRTPRRYSPKSPGVPATRSSCSPTFRKSHSPASICKKATSVRCSQSRTNQGRIHPSRSSPDRPRVLRGIAPFPYRNRPSSLPPRTAGSPHISEARRNEIVSKPGQRRRFQIPAFPNFQLRILRNNLGKQGVHQQEFRRLCPDIPKESRSRKCSCKCVLGGRGGACRFHLIKSVTPISGITSASFIAENLRFRMAVPSCKHLSGCAILQPDGEARDCFLCFYEAIMPPPTAF